MALIDTVEVASQSTGEIYMVQAYDDGTASCTCRGWTFSKKPVWERTCRHIKEAGYSVFPLDHSQIVKHVASIFAPVHYLSDIFKAVAKEDEDCRQRRASSTSARVPQLTDTEREVLNQLIELFDSPAVAPNEVPITGNIGTNIAAWFLKAALDERLHDCRGDNSDKAREIQRVRCGQKLKCPSHGEHFGDRWSSTRP